MFVYIKDEIKTTTNVGCMKQKIKLKKEIHKHSTIQFSFLLLSFYNLQDNEIVCFVFLLSLLSH